MENDARSSLSDGAPDAADPDDRSTAVGPVLPVPRMTGSELPPEVWERWADQLDDAPARGRPALRRWRWLVPTRGAAIIATLGWAGAVIAQMLLLAALVPSFDLGNSRGFVVPLDESAWFGATTIVSAAAASLGWLAWTVGAAFNVRRVSPLSTSPLLPLAVYVGGAAIVVAGLLSQGDERTPLVLGGFAWLGVGHVLVVGSFRSAAYRIGALGDEFAKLLWLPMAGVTYRVFVNVVLTLLPDAWKTTLVLFGLGTLGGLFVVGMMLSTWRATTSFEQACHRLNTRALGHELPPIDKVAEAWRQANAR